MCLIVSSYKGQEIKKEHLEKAYQSNKDGAGLMYSKDGRLIVQKGFFSFDNLYEQYVKKCIGNPHVVHLRYRTSGLMDRDNCHPFIIREDEEHNPLLAFAHNGSINGFSRINSSDTVGFNKEILQEFDKDAVKDNWWRIPELKKMFELALGGGNRLVLMDYTGHIEIINEKTGEWIDGCDGIWASNDMYKTLKHRVCYETEGCSPGGNRKYTYQTPYKPSSSSTTTSSSTVVKPNVTENNSDQNHTTTKFSDENIKYEDFLNIPAEELAEVDRYLAELNKN